MSTFTKVLLSGSTNGTPIKVTSNSSPGTLIHTAVAGSSAMDEIWIFAINTAIGDLTLTIQYGGTVSPNNDIIYNVASKDGLKCIVPGLLLQNSLEIRAYSSTSDFINIHGFVNRIT
jgi:hypothetical protein